MAYNKSATAKGFTIIEVLIVLAVAGLIMLIIFLAVPALQRNSRNNGRNNDAARIVAAITECMATRNALITSCDSDAEIEQGTMKVLETIDVSNGPSYQQTVARVWFGSRCTTGGDQAVGGGSPNSFTVSFQLEPNENRCLATE